MHCCVSAATPSSILNQMESRTALVRIGITEYGEIGMQHCTTQNRIVAAKDAGDLNAREPAIVELNPVGTDARTALSNSTANRFRAASERDMACHLYCVGQVRLRLLEKRPCITFPHRITQKLRGLNTSVPYKCRRLKVHEIADQGLQLLQ